MRFEALEQRRLLAGIDFTIPQFHDVQTDGFLSGPTAGAPQEIALSYVRQNAGNFGLVSSDLADGGFSITDQYTDLDSGVTHIYLAQEVNDLRVNGATINVNVSRDGEVINVGSTFVSLTSNQVIDGNPIAASTAFSEFASELDFELTENPEVLRSEASPEQSTIVSAGGLASGSVLAELRYVPTPEGLELAWSLEVPLLGQGQWFDATVSAIDGQVLTAHDRVNHFSYEVFELPNDGPAESGRSLAINPADPVASPFGWHDANGLPGPDFFDTRGNNVIAQQDRNGDGATTLQLTAVSRPAGGPGLNFNFPADLTQDPSAYTDASVTNLFYLSNVIHDVAYRYGFDEFSGNFQSTNYTGLGQSGDPVIAYTQSGAGLATPTLNNASFVSRPDGQSPILIMFEFDLDLSDRFGGGVLPNFQPRRDGSFAAHVPLHEYAHGITNRLVGGPSSVGSLANLQSNAMGEGWSDFFALMLTQQASDLKSGAYPVGDYLNGPGPLNPGAGSRRFPYSFDTSIDPLTFANYNNGTSAGIPNTEQHNAGEIWASALWDLNWILIDKYGFDADLYDGTGGNNLTLQLVMDGLKLTPSNPTFMDARDAILLADVIRNDGVNHKEIWEAFARRGMGFSAIDDTTGTLGSNSDMVSPAFDSPTPFGRVSGVVFTDINGNGSQDSGEGGIPNWEVFVDLNNSGTRDAFEPTTRTDGGGNYAFEFFFPGTFTIGQVTQGELTQISPPTGGHTVTLITQGSEFDADFALRPGDAQTVGLKFHDLNGDGRREECEIIPGTIQPPCVREPGVPNVWIFVDYDNDTQLDADEPAAITGPNGEYTLTIDRNGTFFVREVMTPGWVQTFPGGASQAHRVTVTNNSMNVALDFGNQTNLDFGDAPLPYPTRSGSGGPIFPILPGFHLGSSVDPDLDGIPSDGAVGDDQDQTTDDEDGAFFNTVISPGASASVDITVTNTRYASGRVNAWLDFNGDGDWSDAGEHIIVDARQGNGSATYGFSVPLDAVAGLTYARVTYGYNRLISGESIRRDIAGEVEDYQVRVLGLTPDAMDDQFRIDQNSTANTLDVLVNDVSSRNGPIFVSDVSTPSRGGRAAIAADGLSISYSPATGFAGVEVFTYTVQDQAGATDVASVTATVVPDTPALALDDSFDVLENTVNNVLDVLSNDLVGQSPPIQIVDVVPSGNSTVSVDRRGTPDPTDDVLLYTANPLFSATDQFSYIIQDEAGSRSTASVTVHNQPSSQNDDVIEYELVATDLTGSPLSAIGVGQPFLLKGFVRDVRADDGDGDPIDRRGIAAAFMDVLYDLSLVSVSGDITFGPDYQNATSGDTSIPGLVDEIGALQTNTIPLGANSILLFEVPFVANAAGAAVFRGDPADERAEANPGSPPEHDSLLFQPPGNIPLQNMRFTNASLAIVSAGSVPIAVDNTFRVAANPAINHSLNVLANDLDNGNPPLSVVGVGAASNGTAQIAPGSGGILYRPASGFVGVDQFSYTIQNSTGLTSSAIVTVQVGDNTKTVNLRLETVPAGPITVGSEFQLIGYVDDLRANDGDGNARDDRGVFAAYFDVLFDSGLVSVVPDATNPLGLAITFSSAYQNGLSGDVMTPNLLNEVGAFQTGTIPLGPEEQVLFSVTMRADGAGIAVFGTDPADISPLRDTLLFEPTDAVAPNEIAFGITSVTILGGSPEGEGLTNLSNPLDVNADGFVTPIDPLLVVNYINRGDSEGESHSGYVDVTGDGHVSPVDVLELVNYLNRLPLLAEAEGEGGVLVQPDLTHAEPVLQSHDAPRSADEAQMLPPLLAVDSVIRPADQREAALANWESQPEATAPGTLDDLLNEDLAEDILGGWSVL